MKWPKGDLAKEVARLRALARGHAERPGDDPREASVQNPIIDVAGDPYAFAGALVDVRSAVLLDSVEAVLVDTKRDDDRTVMMMVLAGRVNYANDRVEHAYIFGPDGAAGIVVELIGLASRAAGAHGHSEAERFALEFKADLERRMADLP